MVSRSAEDVKRHIAVVPYSKTEPHIQNQTACKLYGRYDYAAYEHLFPYYSIPLKHFIEQTTENETYASDADHRPMAVSSPKCFNAEINNAAYDEQEEIL